MRITTSKDKWVWIIGLWILITSFNLTKAFHIDDTFHLEAAQWLSNHPTQPLSGMINWGESDPSPVYSFNNPPLFFYMMAGLGQVFGYSEIAMHVLESVFVLLAFIFFDKLVRLFIPPGSPVLMILFAFCPTFIINQNVMLDIPVLSIMLGFAYYLVKSTTENGFENYLFAIVFLTIGILIKYSVLPLFPVFIIIVMRRKQFAALWLLAIPVLVLGAWSLWNIAEFGSVHLLRPSAVPLYLLPFKMLFSLMAFFACLGAISFYTFHSNLNKQFHWISISLIMLTVLLATLYLNGLFSGLYLQKILYLTFIVNGFAVVIQIYPGLKEKLTPIKNINTNDPDVIIGLLAIALTFFFVLYAPFMATRHVLLVVPLLLILSRNHICHASKFNRMVIVSLTVFFGVVLGVDDWRYADYYRQILNKMDVSTWKGRVWTVGHWGWQWYSVQHGFQPYHSNLSNPKTGDMMVFPKNVSSQKLHPSVQLRIVDKIWEDRHYLAPITGSDFGSMYLSNFGKNPWTVSTAPFDTIFVAEVVVDEVE